MKINPILSFNFFQSNKTAFKGKSENKIQKNNEDSTILSELDYISALNFSSVSKNDYNLGLSHDELLKRTDKDALHTYTLLTEDSPEYQALDEGDKLALVHLLKAGKIIEDINFVIDDADNLPFRDYLDFEIAKGNDDAKMTKRLFYAQRGIFAIDTRGNNISLVKGLTQKPGLGLYPSDLAIDEFHSILIKMLNEGKIEEVRKILNQRSFVERNGDELKAVDYIDKFKDEFSLAADELEKASETSTNEDFNEYLRLQAKALRTPDPMLDAYADVKWAELQNTPLEFTIARENYKDRMTPSVFENDKLKNLLKKYDIQVYPKDCIGARIGIVNKESTEKILKIKDFLPVIAKSIPLSDQYEQKILSDKEIKQTMVDVDVIGLYGDSAACRAGTLQAQNLPNNDKLAIKALNGGKRNVYHRQIMNSGSVDPVIYLNTLFAPELHKYLSKGSWLLFVAGHENGHSLGPEKSAELGKSTNIIEETKADLISVLTADILNKEGIYSDEERSQILFRAVQRGIMASKPKMSQAHRMKALIQMNYLIEDGAVQISDDGIISADLEKVFESSKKMLKEIIEIQLSHNAKKAEEFINKYYYWPDSLEKVAQNIIKISKILNPEIVSPLADKLLSEKI